LALDKFNSVWAFGRNFCGQLGLGDTLDRNVPCIIPTLPDCKTIACGENHSLALDVQDILWVFGNNQYKQLGTFFTDENVLQPIQSSQFPVEQVYAGGNRSLVYVIYLRSWQCWGRNKLCTDEEQFGEPQYKHTCKLVSMGYSHTLFLDYSSKLWAYGSNEFGQLGLGDRLFRNSPTLVKFPSKITQIAAGLNHSMIVDSDGYLYGFGANDQLQLGIQDEECLTTVTRNPSISNIATIELSDLPQSSDVPLRQDTN
jgi:alpha-tubulin suppressor-like RCC1 family protein